MKKIFSGASKMISLREGFEEFSEEGSDESREILSEEESEELEESDESSNESLEETAEEPGLSSRNELTVARKDLMKMVNYHMEKLGIGNENGTIACTRFDLESKLLDYDSRVFDAFKKSMLAPVIENLEISSTSKTKSSMENDLSFLLYEMLCTRMATCDSYLWYYENGLWKLSNSQDYLWNIVSRDFIKYLGGYPSLSNAKEYLGSSASRKRIVEDLKLKLCNPDFHEKIDCRKDIIGVKNGTLNVETGELKAPREGDFISKNTKIDYTFFDMESSKTQELFSILRQVFPVPEILKFFVRSCSTFLEGCNSKKIFYVWWGNGNNCKTGMTSLVHAALGEYCGTAPVSLITGNRSSSGNATPELCHIEGKLAVFLQEPNQKEEIKTGRIKELTGNDKIYIRPLFREGREIDVKCKIIHVCNFPTAGPNTDTAFKKRLIAIPFMSTFMDSSEYNRKKSKNLLNDYCYEIKEGVEEKLKRLATTFLSMLVQEYMVFKEVGLQIPDAIREKTEEFLTYNNYCLKFIRKMLMHMEDEESCVSSNDLYEVFKDWFKNMYPGRFVPNNESFCAELRDEGFVENEEGIIKNIAMCSQDQPNSFAF